MSIQYPCFSLLFSFAKFRWRKGDKTFARGGGGGGQDLNFPPPIAKIYLESWPEEEGFYIIFISSLTSGVVGTILIEIATINIKGLSVRNTQ